jgi:poly-beta-1,6-N-acetyl-D-glucosamine synthase
MSSLFLLYNVVFLTASFLIGGVGLFKFRKRNVSVSSNCINLNDLTVLIPFRNECENLPQLVRCLESQLKTPKKIIFIDDHSEDESRTIVEASSFGKDLICLPNNLKGKKHAIRFAMDSVETEFVLTLDSDLTFSNHYFKNLESLNKADMLLLPVFMKGKTIQGRLYELDYSLSHLMNQIACGLGYPILASGANLLFRKEKFLAFDSFRSHQHIASGDDVFLLNDFLKNDCEVKNITSCNHAVETAAPESIAEFLKQRLRWLSKSNVSVLPLSARIAIFVAIYHMFFLASSWYFLSTELYLDFIYLLLLKVVFEMLFCYRFFLSSSRLKTWILLPLSTFLYPFYILILIFGLQFFSIEWKGRSIKTT